MLDGHEERRQTVFHRPHGVSQVCNLPPEIRATYGRTDAEDAVARYPVGSVVAISYSPSAPQRSVLEPGTWRGGTSMTVLVPVTVVAIGAALICEAVLLLVSKPRS
jgi:hypothetical protein